MIHFKISNWVVHKQTKEEFITEPYFYINIPKYIDNNLAKFASAPIIMPIMLSIKYYLSCLLCW